MLSTTAPDRILCTASAGDQWSRDLALGRLCEKIGDSRVGYDARFRHAAKWRVQFHTAPVHNRRHGAKSPPTETPCPATRPWLPLGIRNCESELPAAIVAPVCKRGAEPIALRNNGPYAGCSRRIIPGRQIRSQLIIRLPPQPGREARERPSTCLVTTCAFSVMCLIANFTAGRRLLLVIAGVSP